MKIHVLFGQRVESYEGEFAPIPLDVIDQSIIDDDPEYQEKKLKKILRGDSDFMSAHWFVVDLGEVTMRLRRILMSEWPELQGQVELPKDVRSLSIKVTEGSTERVVVTSDF